LPRKRKGFFDLTQGDLNKIVDSVFHPLAREEPIFWLADFVGHGLIEQNPILSIKKFIHYDVPKIAKQYRKRNARRKRYRPCRFT